MTCRCRGSYHGDDCPDEEAAGIDDWRYEPEDLKAIGRAEDRYIAALFGEDDPGRRHIGADPYDPTGGMQ